MLRTLTAATMLGLATMAGAQDTPKQAPKMEIIRLAIGDTAPAIDIAHWLKGDRVEAFEENKIYVIEFWATWCGYCKESVPHLSKLQKHYKDYDVTFISVSDEDLQTVVEFFAKTDVDDKTWTSKMQFTVATDPDKSVKQAYMSASGMQGLPAAYIIGKDGRIEWIGRPHHPEGDIDRALEGVVHDSWDREAFANLREMRNRGPKLVRAKKYEEALDLYRKLLDVDAPSAAFDYKNSMFRVLLRNLDRPEEAYPIGKELVEVNWDKASWLNGFAWMLATDKAIKTRDLSLALKAAKRGVELTRQRDAAILDTLARVHSEQGNLAAAIRWQELAVNNAKKGSKMAKNLAKSLQDYRKRAAD